MRQGAGGGLWSREDHSRVFMVAKITHDDSKGSPLVGAQASRRNFRSGAGVSSKGLEKSNNYYFFVRREHTCLQ